MRREGRSGDANRVEGGVHGPVVQAAHVDKVEQRFHQLPAAPSGGSEVAVKAAAGILSP
ncbi:hypothetical protein [Saccharothrix deserti]|uniref:hypothetical protein n=1 Tax=Saccharothrix deserti TaxID=2593674 RepID=UPI001EE40CE6|nr:hypothetical protein [Saccharothrix deserti]